MVQALPSVKHRHLPSGLSGLAILAGRVLRDVVALIGQSLVLILVGVAFGLRAPLGAFALAFFCLGTLVFFRENG